MSLRLVPGEVVEIAAPLEGDTTEYGLPPDVALHYKLRLPDDYDDDPTRVYPIMFIASPVGDATMGTLSARLTRDRWIVAMLVESRNRSRVWLANFLAAYDDVMQRVRTRPGMLFCTGVSGAARVCSVYPQFRPGFRGLLLQAHGFWSRRLFDDPNNKDLIVYGTFGTHDPNRRHAWLIRRELPGSVNHHTEIWNGGHDWAPPDVLDRALDWMEEKAFVLAAREQAQGDAARWYADNQIARFSVAQTDIERYAINARLQALAKSRPLSPTTLAALRSINETVATFADSVYFKRELGAYIAYRELLRREEVTAWEALGDTIESYDRVARAFPDTRYGEYAAIRRESLVWETGLIR